MAQASLHAIAEKARRESTVVPFSEMATPSPGAKELPNVAKSEDVSKEGIDSSIDVKTDKKQSVVTEETAAEEPQPEKVEKSTSSTIAENDDSAKCADIKEVEENKKLNGSVDVEEVKETIYSLKFMLTVLHLLQTPLVRPGYPLLAIIGPVFELFRTSTFVKQAHAPLWKMGREGRRTSGGKEKEVHRQKALI